MDIPDDWGDIERETFYELVDYDAGIYGDESLQFLFDGALFDSNLTGEEREQMMNALEDYLMDEYGIDFDSDFDWESYREWYG